MAVYGSFPEILFYSIPLELIEACVDSDVQLNVYPVQRLSGKFMNGFIFEEFGPQKLSQYGWY